GRYVLRLSASDGKLSSSDEVTITVRDEPGNPFGTPANLKAVRVSSNQIDLQWDDVTGETSYLLIARSGGTRVLRIRLGANANSFSHSELSPKTTYTYKVRADRSTDEGGNSAWSDLLRVTTTEGKDVPPPQPSRR
ncbi:MAG: fibronectin type III domain-containing protein, partial [Gammaproteobacteria bacterium]|nr:fibronectin type III domain-containing protein [Gammaproteobacteria bacterium]